jgi:tetratricopeptide (TPR) repeat protein
MPLAGQGGRENSTELYRQGAEAFRQGDMERSGEIFRRVISISPWYCLGYYGLGRVFLQKKETIEQAQVMLRKAVDLDREFARGYFYLGMAYMLDEKYRPALHAFKKAYALDDTLVESLYNMSAIYDTIRDSHKAKVYYRRYLDARERQEEDIIF